eukprot:2656564-Pyramimonas_sp.AAC.1
MVPFMFGQMGAESLKKLGVPVEWKSYAGMGHSSCAQELTDVRAFVEKQLAKVAVPPPSASEVEAMSVKELKAYLSSKGKDFSGCFEKSELVNLAKSTL